jgi:hypothetical protein
MKTRICAITGARAAGGSASSFGGLLQRRHIFVFILNFAMSTFAFIVSAGNDFSLFF